MSETKQLTVTLLPSLEPNKKRKVTEHKNWKSNVSTEKQWNLLNQLMTNNPVKDSEEKLLSSQIQYKLSGYKYQDMEKNKYNAETFITMSQVLELFSISRMICQYCQETCLLLYEKVRDSQQWSLDRIDNDLGHSYNNVCLSCLKCNLKRRVTQYKKFLFTKNAVICKLDQVVQTNFHNVSVYNKISCHENNIGNSLEEENNYL